MKKIKIKPENQTLIIVYKYFSSYSYIIKNNKLFLINIPKKMCFTIDNRIEYLIQKHKLNSYFLNFNLVYHNFVLTIFYEYLARKGKLD